MIPNGFLHGGMLMKEADIVSRELIEKGWIKVWMIFEVQAAAEDVCVSALKKHVDGLGAQSYVKIMEQSFTDVDKIDAPDGLKQRGVNNLFTQVSEVTLMARDFEGVMNAVINYAPTAVEIVAPEKITISMRDAQNALVSVADMMHKFANAGIGGMLIKGE